MAAFRQNVPLRAVAGTFVLANITMCSTRSAVPGPLRTEQERQLLELESATGFAPDYLQSSGPGRSAQFNSSSSSNSDAPSQQTDKVA
jgi:hypothetical protein